LASCGGWAAREPPILGLRPPAPSRAARSAGSAVAVVLDLVRRIHAALDAGPRHAAIDTGDDHLQLHARPQLLDAEDVHRLVAAQAQRLPGFAGRNTSGSTPMPTRFERWMRSKLSTTTAFTPSRKVPFAAQSRDEPMPYSLPPKITSGVPSAL
jgi:hypothetical protein